MGAGQVGWKQISIVFLVLVALLFVGAGIFKVLEEHFYDPGEPPERVQDVEDIVVDFVRNHTNVSHHQVFELLRQIDIARHGYSLSNNENISQTYHLDYMESWYFCMTIVTTIGYGHMGPLTDAGKVFCCIYAFIGIPVWFILLTLVGAQLGDTSRWIEKRVRELLSKCNKGLGKFRAPGLAVSLTVMMTAFFFLPAVIFHIVESWTYLEAIYFCVITLTTVGLGDFVAALPSDSMSSAANAIYKLSVFLWITVGLAFLAGSLERIGRALKFLGEKVTDLDLDPAEIDDPPDDETNYDKNQPNGTEHGSDPAPTLNGTKESKKDKEIKPHELADKGKDGQYTVISMKAHYNSLIKAP